MKKSWKKLETVIFFQECQQFKYLSFLGNIYSKQMKKDWSKILCRNETKLVNSHSKIGIS